MSLVTKTSVKVGDLVMTIRPHRCAVSKNELHRYNFLERLYIYGDVGIIIDVVQETAAMRAIHVLTSSGAGWTWDGIWEKWTTP